MRVFVGPILRSVLTENEISALVLDFKQYKSNDKIPDNFGRDVPYHWPNSAVEEELFHLHLAAGSKWPNDLPQFFRTSDVHLIYSHGFSNSDDYVLLAILQPNAHELARNRDIIDSLAKQAAVFRESH